MSLPHMAFLAQPIPIHCCCVHLRPFLSAMDYSDNQSFTRRFCLYNSRIKFSTIPFVLCKSVANQHPLGEVLDEVRDYKDLELHSEQICWSNLYYNEGSEEVAGHQSETTMTCTMKELKETLRKKRIGLANKGKVPWNKGRKHSPETRARIKERTLEAMRDPKIRKRMSEAPRVLSEQTKNKIGSSLRKLWAERLKRKRSKEKVYSSWAESIAEAAKRGGINEEELNWDSYEKLREEMAIRRDEEKAKHKELNRLQAEKKALKRAEKMTHRAQKKLNHRYKAEPRDKQEPTGGCQKRRKKEKPAVLRELRFKSRLRKIEGAKLIDGPPCTPTGVMTNLQSALEKLDIESIKKEQQRNRVSLADQIQAAREKRAQIITKGSAIDQR